MGTPVFDSSPKRCLAGHAAARVPVIPVSSYDMECCGHQPGGVNQRASSMSSLGAMEQLRRAGKRQAAPFSNGDQQSEPNRPGRKSGDKHGRHGHRRVAVRAAGPDTRGVAATALPEL